MTDAEMTALLPELPVPCGKSAWRTVRFTDAEHVGAKYTASGFEYGEVLYVSPVGLWFTPGGASGYYAHMLGKFAERARTAYDEFAGQ